jgi:tetratricopeptide (TPR) repeat protein
MNKFLIGTFVCGFLVSIPVGDALAGHGGGGGGHVGGFSGGGLEHGMSGMGHSSFDHVPSFSSPGAGLPRSNFTPANRPGFQPSGGGQGFNVGQRGTINNVQRFGENRSGIENRANFENRTNFGDRTNIGNRSIAGNQFNVNRSLNINGRNYGNWYHGDWHGHWDHPWHGWPAGWWAAGFVAGWGWGAATAPWAWGYWPYYNPYCPGVVVIDGGTIDYSQPILTAAQPAYAVNDQSGGADVRSTAEDQAMKIFDSARESFMSGDYKTALSRVESAIAKLPNDVVLHEFRGLALFALKRYQESAAAVYAVLSVGPGWDWTTLCSLYPDVDVYTEQLRALEEYRRQNPKSAEARFLLAYHYLTCGHNEAAAKELKEVVSLNPKDQLSAQLLASLTNPADADEAKTNEPAAPPKPADAAALTGNWKSTRSDGAIIALNLAADGKFTWKYAQKDKPQEFGGEYSVADNLLILKQNNNPIMVGQVTPLSGNRFNFKLAGDNPNDPGLTFSK